MFEDSVYKVGDLTKSISRCFDIAFKNDSKTLKKWFGPSKHSANEIVKHGKVYFQGKRTILKIGQDIFMSTPEKDEKFDEEKGLLICIMKAMGMSTTDFLNVYSTAKTVKEKARSIKQDKTKNKTK